VLADGFYVFFNMDSPHIPIERTVAFLAHGQTLDPSEEAHLVRCDECRLLMIKAAMDPEISPEGLGDENQS
jgi:hypothetical protein